jgi:hypothetical protein
MITWSNCYCRWVFSLRICGPTVNKVGIKLAYYNSEDVSRLRELLAKVSPWHDPRSVNTALTLQQITLGQVLISVPAIKHPAKIGSQTISAGCWSHTQGLQREL